MGLELKFKEQIQCAIAMDIDLLTLRDSLLVFKNAGMTQHVMRQCLTDLRQGKYEERVLELLDYVDGFCSPSLRLF